MMLQHKIMTMFMKKYSSVTTLSRSIMLIPSKPHTVLNMKNISMNSKQFVKKEYCVNCFSNVLQYMHSFQQGHFNLDNKYRSYKTESRHAFEMDQNVEVDTPVFTYRNDRYYIMISLFGIAQFLFWSTCAYFTRGTLKQVESPEKDEMFDRENFWGKVLSFQSQHKNKFSIICVLIAYVVLAFAWIAPKRAVHKLTLLRGGENIKITTYTHLGMKRDFTVPLDNISFSEARRLAKNQLSMRVKGQRFYFGLDTRDGQFHNPALFDYVIGLKRNI